MGNLTIIGEDKVAQIVADYIHSKDNPQQSSCAEGEAQTSADDSKDADKGNL